MPVRISNISVQESISGAECQVFGLKLFRIASNQIRIRVEIYTDRFSLPSSVSRTRWMGFDRIGTKAAQNFPSNFSRFSTCLPPFPRKSRIKKSIARSLLYHVFTDARKHTRENTTRGGSESILRSGKIDGREEEKSCWKTILSAIIIENQRVAVALFEKRAYDWRPTDANLHGQFVYAATAIVVPIQFPSSLHF